MTGPSGNSEFCFSSTSMFPSASPRGTLSVSGNQNSLFPLRPVIKCLILLAVVKPKLHVFAGTRAAKYRLIRSIEFNKSDRKTNTCNQWKRLTTGKVISRGKLPYVRKATKAEPPRQLLCGFGVLTKVPPVTPAPECYAGARHRTNTQGLKITEENVLPLQLHLQMVRRLRDFLG